MDVRIPLHRSGGEDGLAGAPAASALLSGPTQCMARCWRRKLPPTWKALPLFCETMAST
jgi:hypothetical protein